MEKALLSREQGFPSDRSVAYLKLVAASDHLLRLLPATSAS